MASVSSGSKPLRRARMPRTSRSIGQSTSATRPVRRARMSGISATASAVGDTISCDSVPGSAFGIGRICDITANGMKILLLSGPL